MSDPASQERGQGPICAHKDTALYAKTIVANFALATATALSVKADQLPPAVVPVWSALRDVLFEKSEHAISNATGTDAFTFSFSGEDCRLIVKVIDWMLSFRMGSEPKYSLIQIVKHLGFVGLAGVLSGKSSTGAAELKFDPTTGLLSLVGSSNKNGFLVMRRIPGITIPRRRGCGAYTVNALQHKPFIDACMEFWPCFDGEVDGIVEQCKAWIAAHPPVTTQRQPLAPRTFTVTVSSKPSGTVTNRSQDFVLKFPWIAGVTMRLVDELKAAVPSKARAYDPVKREWAVKLEHKDAVMALLVPHYDLCEIAGPDTPTTQYAQPATGYRPRYGRAYFRR